MLLQQALTGHWVPRRWRRSGFESCRVSGSNHVFYLYPFTVRVVDLASIQ